MEVSGQLHAPADLPPRERAPRERAPRYPLDMTPGGPQSPSGRCGVEKTSLAPADNRTPAVKPHIGIAVIILWLYCTTVDAASDRFLFIHLLWIQDKHLVKQSD
jgi:hypothetical protein